MSASGQAKTNSSGKAMTAKHFCRLAEREATEEVVGRPDVPSWCETFAVCNSKITTKHKTNKTSRKSRRGQAGQKNVRRQMTSSADVSLAVTWPIASTKPLFKMQSTLSSRDQYFGPIASDFRMSTFFSVLRDQIPHALDWSIL